LHTQSLMHYNEITTANVIHTLYSVQAKFDPAPQAVMGYT